MSIQLELIDLIFWFGKYKDMCFYLKLIIQIVVWRYMLILNDGRKGELVWINFVFSFENEGVSKGFRVFLEWQIEG